MQHAILIIICLQFFSFIYIVLKSASNNRRLYQEREEIYKLEKEIGEEYRKELLRIVKNIEERQELLLYKYKKGVKEKTSPVGIIERHRRS